MHFKNVVPCNTEAGACSTYVQMCVPLHHELSNSRPVCLPQENFKHYKDMWRLNSETWEWEQLPGRGGPSARSGHRMALHKHSIILFGGFQDTGKVTTCACMPHHDDKPSSSLRGGYLQALCCCAPLLQCGLQQAIILQVRPVEACVQQGHRDMLLAEQKNLLPEPVVYGMQAVRRLQHVRQWFSLLIHKAHVHTDKWGH